MTIATKERPILFSGPMVRAILDGRKTQTRRVIKPQPEAWRHDSKGWELLRTPDCRPVYIDTFAKHYCPYGQPGGRLWVRETWTPDHAAFYPNWPVVYRAENGFDYERNEDGKVFSPEQNAWYPYRWRPSIHMPRWASRITLEITSVRVERLQAITEADAKAEGVDEAIVLPGDQGSFVSSFANVWHEINGAESWRANPWVWVVSFKRCQDGRH